MVCVHVGSVNQPPSKLLANADCPSCIFEIHADRNRRINSSFFMLLTGKAERGLRGTVVFR